MEQEKLFQFMLENTLAMMFVFDAEGTILYTNPTAEKKLKYTDGLYHSSIIEVFPREEDIKESMNKSADEMQKMMAYRGNRTCFPVNARIIQYSGTYQGKKEVFLCIADDISEENFLQKKIGQVEEEAKEADKVKSEFVANVTHELRTPVNGILGNAQALLNQEKEPAKIKLLQLIERGCRDMNNLINNILDFSKLEAGKFTLESRQFDFHNMIEYVKGNHKNRMTEKGLEFSVTVSEEIPQCIIGDELRIVQVLNNLISNAYKFTSVGGVHVEILKTAQMGTKAELFFMIMDSGIGIAKENQDKLFKSFSQVDMSISRKYGGTGLGLNICKQLVELMGGDIHVESEEGKGTVFSFHIWIELPEDCCKINVANQEWDEQTFTSNTARTEEDLLNKLHKLSETQTSQKVWQYGSQENKEELEKKMSKLMLSVVMENWEKAEMLAETVKQLVEEAPREVKSAAFRLKMAVQRGDTQKVTDMFEGLQRSMEEFNGSSK